MIWFFFWWKVVKSAPEHDPYISPEERKYIQDSLGNVPNKVHLSNHGGRQIWQCVNKDNAIASPVQPKYALKNM